MKFVNWVRKIFYRFRKDYGKGRMDKNNRCVFCGAVIPEGIMICPRCELAIEEKENNNRMSGDV